MPCNCQITVQSTLHGVHVTCTVALQSDDAPNKTTFPLNCGDDESVFSFGNVFNNISAILTKGNDSFTLKLVDLHRRVEMLSASLDRALFGRKCLGMFTNEMNGLIALLTSSEESGSIEVLHTNLDIGYIPAVKGTSLASTLRLVAQSSRPAKDFAEALPKNEANGSFGVLVSGDTICNDVNAKSIDDIVDEACSLLVKAANSLIDGEEGEEAHLLNGRRSKGRQSKKNGESSKKWATIYEQGRAMIASAQRGKESMKNGVKVLSSAESSTPPKTFIDVAFGESARLILSSKKELRKDVLPVLVDLLATQLVSAREAYGIDAGREHLLLQILKRAEYGNIDKLDLVDTILGNVRDIPEALLVSILRFMLRNVDAEDAVAHYKKLPEHTKRTKQSVRDASDEKASTRLLSQTVLDFTSKIVTNSKCNHSFLTKAIQDSFSSSVEVETILFTLSKLLKSGNLHAQDDCGCAKISLSMGAIDWIAAVTDAHMGTVMKITSEGGLVIDKMQRIIRSVMSQSEFATELKELADYSASVASSLEASAIAAAKSNFAAESNSSETVVTPYSFERLAF